MADEKPSFAGRHKVTVFDKAPVLFHLAETLPVRVDAYPQAGGNDGRVELPQGHSVKANRNTVEGAMRMRAWVSVVIRSHSLGVSVLYCSRIIFGVSVHSEAPSLWVAMIAAQGWWYHSDSCISSGCLTQRPAARSLARSWASEWSIAYASNQCLSSALCSCSAWLTSIIGEAVWF